MPSNTNLFKSYVVRDNKLLFVDFVKLIRNGDMSQNIIMKGGDKIYIAAPCESYIMVIGAVKKEKVINVTDGTMSLKKAIAEAGGVSFAGGMASVQVVRGGSAFPKKYILNWEQIMSLPNDSLLLMNGDLVYVTSNHMV